ncbi:protein of unknown function [Moritella yayanosii]|uniref:Uncharacterized protein n=1 Tax=Moritella yayanosii TaxID=69539 RepID=A0A330LK72_9GAMM|nr:protein of unknown function [Moritella yayanosii]
MAKCFCSTRKKIISLILCLRFQLKDQEKECQLLLGLTDGKINVNRDSYGDYLGE